MKNIAILAENLSGGGVEKVILNLSKGFEAINYRVDIILLDNTISYDLPTHINLYILKKKKLFTKYSYAMQIKKILQQNDTSLLISNFTHFSGIQIVDFVNFKNTLTIVHNTQSKRRFKRHSKNGILKKIKKYRIEKSFKDKNLVCVSDGVKDDLVQNFTIAPKTLQTIYNPFDIDEIRRLANKENPKIPKESYIIHVGRFELVHKRQDILLKAYQEANVSQKLVLLGEGDDKEKIVKLIEELGLQDSVILAGFDANPYPWIKNATLFVFASDYEGLPTVLIESLILQTPVVSTNCDSGPSEILVGELANFLVPIRDVEALASSINRALQEYPVMDDAYIEKFIQKNIIAQYCNYLP
jgi:glycosyltransferase involved in cell wall biosynthesis